MAATAAQKRTEPQGGHAGRITAIATGMLEGVPVAVTAGEDGVLIVWDLVNEVPIRWIEEPQAGEPLAVSLAEVDGGLVCASGWSQASLLLHDVGTRTQLGSPVQGGSARFTAVAFVAAGERPLIVGGTSDGSLVVRDLGGDIVASATVADAVVGLAADVVGERAVFVARSANGEVSAWTVDEGLELLWTAQADGALGGIATWTAEGVPVAVYGEHGGLTLADLATGAFVGNYVTHGAGRIRALTAGSASGVALLAVAREDGAIEVWADDGGASSATETEQERIDAIAFAPNAAATPAVIVGGDDGRIWRWEPLWAQAPGAAPDKVEWLTDASAREDLLQRRPLARALASRLDRIRRQDPDNAFLVHLDGAWGTGKSTILGFLRDDLEPGWLVVDFDAWRQSRVGPPWWALLVALRERVRADLGWWARMRLRTAETFARVRRTGSPYLFAIAVLVAAVVAVLLLAKMPSWKGAGDIAASLTAIVAALGTLWAGGLLASRFLLWDSAKGAVVYEQSKPNPMEALADHFGWLMARSGKPVAFFVDDLDRCAADYVVDLLEAVQTLLRDAPRRLDGAAAGGIGPYFVVAADGAWIRKSYELRYCDFSASVGEAGRPLGYLFLDKLFQLTVAVPTVTASEQGIYLSGLLRGPSAAGPPDPAEVADVRGRIDRSETDDQVIGALQSASPAIRRALAPAAVERLSEPAIEAATEHALQGFSHLLEPNPRAMKRFVNSYGIARVVLTLENALVSSDSLALWTILRSRWPVLADHLAKRPDDVLLIGAGAQPPEGTAAAAAAMFDAPDVTAVVNFARGGPLTPELVRACAGGSPAALRPEPA